MNPLADIGMTDWFWNKYKELCVIRENPHGRCHCGRPQEYCRIPLRIGERIVFTNAGVGIPDFCLACQTRLLWKAYDQAKGIMK